MKMMQLNPDQQAILQQQIEKARRYVSKRAVTRPFGKIATALWLRDATLMMLGGEIFENELKAIYNHEIKSLGKPKDTACSPKMKPAANDDAPNPDSITDHEPQSDAEQAGIDCE